MDSIFRIASHSKLFTAITVMRARDAGKLRLDDPVTGYLPWFDIRNRHPEARPVTVRHLLTHTAGLPRESIHPRLDRLRVPGSGGTAGNGFGSGDHLRHRNQVEVLEPRVHSRRHGGRRRHRRFLRRPRDRRDSETAGDGLHQRRPGPGRPAGPARDRLRSPDARWPPRGLPFRGRPLVRPRDRPFLDGPRHAPFPLLADAGPRPPQRGGPRQQHPAGDAAGPLAPLLVGQRLGPRFLGAPHRRPRPDRPRRWVSRLPDSDPAQPGGEDRRRRLHERR